MRYIVFFILFLGLFSCISNKKVTYLQYEDELKQDVETDSVLRSYSFDNSQYTIQVDDRIDIKIASLTPVEYNPFAINDPFLVEDRMSASANGREVTKGYVVKPDGCLILPMIGKIGVKGMYLTQLEDTLTSLVQDYLKDPVVKVGLLNFQYVILSEGKMQMFVTDNVNITVLQAISKANGLDEYVDLSKVKIIRHQDSKAKVFYLNLLDEKMIESQFYYIKPNDVIILSPVKQRAYLKYFSKNVSPFATIVSALVSIATLSVAMSR